jgi:filamentous hemagglutinin family protein
VIYCLLPTLRIAFVLMRIRSAGNRGIVSGVALAAVICVSPARGEVTLDRTLGNPPPLMGPDYLVLPSHGKLVRRNLFHSFARFDVQRSRGESVTFRGPSSVNNVLVRVTGGEPAHINGTIAVQIPGANLFFMNPSGVMVGPDAKIMLSGSLAITTADYIALAGVGRFDAVQPENSVLTTKPPRAFGFLGRNKSAVVFSGRAEDPPTQSVMPGESLAVVASMIRIDTHRFVADRARIALVTRSAGGRVVLDPETAYPRVEEAIVDPTTAIEISHGRFQAGFGGSVAMRSGDLNVTKSTIYAVTRNEPGGDIDIAARDIALHNSVLDVSTSGDANGGNLNLSGRNVLIDGHGKASDGTDAAIAANSNVGKQDSGSGRGGDITIAAGDSLTLQRGAPVLASARKNGIGGNIRVTVAGTLRIDSQASTGPQTTGFIEDAQPSFDGAAATASLGSITIDADRLEIVNRGQITSETNTAGNAGNITLSVKSSFIIDGTDQGRTDFTGVEARVGNVKGVGATGRGGTITIRAGDLRVRNGGAITATTFGQGDGGQVDIITSGDAIISGSSDFDFTGVFTRSALEPADGTGGKGGDVSLVARSLTIDGPANVGADSLSTGDAGTVTVRTIGPITLSDGAAITVASALTTGGTMRLQSDTDLILRNARVAASADANGGNIDIIAPRVVSLFRGEITGKTRLGDGGRITIDPKVTSLASGTINGSAGGRDVAVRIDGILLRSTDSQIISDNAIFSLDTDLASSIVPFNADVTGATARLQDFCGIRASQISSFSFIGRGGVMSDPARATPSASPDSIDSR